METWLLVTAFSERMCRDLSVRSMSQVDVRYTIVTSGEVDVVVSDCSRKVDGDDDRLKNRQDENCDEHDVCMKGE